MASNPIFYIQSVVYILYMYWATPIKCFQSIWCIKWKQSAFTNLFEPVGNVASSMLVSFFSLLDISQSAASGIIAIWKY